MSRWHLRGVVLPDDTERDLWIVDGVFVEGPVVEAVTVATGCYLVPGLVDAHCHIGIEPTGPVTTVERAKELALIDRSVGVLTIRDVGSPLPYPELDTDPEVPHLIRAGRHIAPPKRYIRGLAVETAEPDLVTEVLTQARSGTGWVKIVGDWIDRDCGDLGPTYTAGGIADAVAAAHSVGAKVAVHTFSEETIDALIAAGVDSIEHGTGLGEHHIAAMARSGTALVPTLTNIENFPRFAEQGEAKFPHYAEHMRRLYAGFPAVVSAAYEAGVPIFVGTDAGSGVVHGLAAFEIMRLHKVGMSTLDALGAGSWRARRWLGLAGIEIGAIADVVAYPSDPRLDLRVLTNPSRILLRGAIVA